MFILHYVLARKVILTFLSSVLFLCLGFFLCTKIKVPPRLIDFCAYILESTEKFHIRHYFSFKINIKKFKGFSLSRAREEHATLSNLMEYAFRYFTVELLIHKVNCFMKTPLFFYRNILGERLSSPYIPGWIIAVLKTALYGVI